MDLNLARTLYFWAKCNTQRQQQLEDWLGEALESIAQGKGASLISSTANGLSVTFSSNSKALTNTEWASTISRALQMLESGPSTGKSVGVIR